MIQDIIFRLVRCAHTYMGRGTRHDVLTKCKRKLCVNLGPGSLNWQETLRSERNDWNKELNKYINYNTQTERGIRGKSQCDPIRLRNEAILI